MMDKQACHGGYTVSLAPVSSSLGISTDGSQCSRVSTVQQLKADVAVASNHDS